MLLSSAAGDSPEASLYGWLTRANAGMNDYYWFSENREHWISGTLGTHSVPTTQCWISSLQDCRVHVRAH